MQQPIGLFDSGVGGTSIWKEIVTKLPLESTVYLADSKHAPYGTKSQDEIIALCFKNTEKLIALGSKIIVVACNTATTNAIGQLRSEFDIPFIGIEPAIRPAALKSQTGTIGILATRGTLNSTLFATTSEQYKAHTEVIEVIGEGLVPIIEKGLLNSPETKKLLTDHLQPMIEANIDYLVLGCSHYPYLVPTLKEILPSKVTIIDSGEAVANQTQLVLQESNLLCTKNCIQEHKMYSNTTITTLQQLLRDFHTQPSFKKLDF